MNPRLETKVAKQQFKLLMTILASSTAMVRRISKMGAHIPLARMPCEVSALPIENVRGPEPNPLLYPRQHVAHAGN